MIDQMELLSGEVPAEPGTNSNQTQVQQNQNITHPNKERILNFQIPFFLFYILLGLAGWVVTVFIFKTKHSEDSYVSPWCPELPKYGTDPRRNLYRCNFLFDLHAFVSENETSFAQESELVWRKSKLTYGDLRCAFRFSTNLSISERIRNEGSLYLQVCVTQSGLLPAARKGEVWAELYTHCKTKRMNFFYQEANGAKSSASQVRSYWRPNWKVNLVGDGSHGFNWKEDGRVDCEPLTNKFYPLLYLNDNFNLARDCIPIDQTIESLPLNLAFRQIDIAKLRDYLRQSDFEEYFRRSDRPNEEFIRENLIASDFKKTGVFHIDHFWWMLATVCVAKCVAKCIPSSLTSFGPIPVYAMLLNVFFITFFGGAFVLLCNKCPKETVKSGDSLGENDRESSIEVPVNHRMPSDQVETNCDFLLNFLRLECRVILRNLVMLLLVPLLFLYICFSLCPGAFSPLENLAIFAFLALCNCLFYLTTIYWTCGRLIFLNSPVSVEDFSKSKRYLDALQISAHFHGQLIVLWVVLGFFSLADFSTPAFFVFTFAWLLNDLASSVCLFELGASIRRLKEMPATRPKLD